MPVALPAMIIGDLESPRAYFRGEHVIIRGSRDADLSGVSEPSQVRFVNGTSPRVASKARNH